MFDLNTLVLHGFLALVYAGDINDRGEITGGAFDPSTKQTPAFLAIPRRDGDDNEVASSTAEVERNSQRIILPESVREVLQQRLVFDQLGAGREGCIDSKKIAIATAVGPDKSQHELGRK
jgi:hypothetical protein